MLESAPQKTSLRIRGVEVPFDVRSLHEITHAIVNEIPDGWRTVITPNLHHVYLLRRNTSLLDTYLAAGLIVPDGWPVAWMLSRASGTQVKRVAGSDLLEGILDADGYGRPLVLVGGESADVLAIVADRAAANGWVVATEPAPSDEVGNPAARSDLIARIAEKGTGGIVVLGLGAPKQEQLAYEIGSGEGGRGHILCLGMAINFSAGRYQRSPGWMQRARLEWVHRILTEPRRLLPRYVRDARALVPTLAENSRSRA